MKVTDINGCLAVSDYINVVILANKKENPYRELTLFPNPSKEFIQLGLPDEQIRDYYQIEIWDIEGKKVMESTKARGKSLAIHNIFATLLANEKKRNRGRRRRMSRDLGHILAFKQGKKTVQSVSSAVMSTPQFKPLPPHKPSP